jgi:hypothetical protein
MVMFMAIVPLYVKNLDCLHYSILFSGKRQGCENIKCKRLTKRNRKTGKPRHKKNDEMDYLFIFMS